MTYKVTILYKDTGDVLATYDKVNIGGMNYQVRSREIELDVFKMAIEDGLASLDENINSFKFVIQDI